MATAPPTTPLLTAEEASQCGIEGRWELVRGEVATYMPVQPEHGRVVNTVSFRVTQFLGTEEHTMGPEIGFLTIRHPDTVRTPDWSLTWREQAIARREGAWIAGGPNLAVEVVSPDEIWSEVQDKVDEYLAAGTQLVWVISPEKRTVHVYRPDAPLSVLHASDSLTGDPVLPGFTLSLTELFRD